MPDAPSSEPLEDLLRGLVGQSLIAPSLHLVDDSLRVRHLAADVADDTVVPLHVWVESARCQRFVLINLVSADAIKTRRTGRQHSEEDCPPQLRLAAEIDGFIRNALAAKSEAGSHEEQMLETVNLVVPAARVSSLPTTLHWRGPDEASNVSGWGNVLVAPEVQETSAQAAVEVQANEEYVAHLATALVTIAGCWSGAPWEPRLWDSDVACYQQDKWTVARTKSRSVVAPELTTRVLSRIGNFQVKVPSDDKVEFFVAPDPARAVDVGLQHFIDDHSFRHEAFIDVTEEVLPEEISIRKFFHLLRAWLTRTLPVLVIGMVRQRIDQMGQSIDDRINKAAGLGAQSKFRIRWFGRHKRREVIQAASEPESKLDDWSLLPAEPKVWSALRSLCFGLLDGGELPDRELQQLLGTGNQRLVLGDRSWISPPPSGPSWEPSELVAALGIGPPGIRSAVDIEWARTWEAVLKAEIGRRSEIDAIDADGLHPEDDPTLTALKQDLARLQAAIDDARRSLLWRMGEFLYDQRHEVDRRIDELKAQREEAERESEDLDAIKQKAKKSKRRALKRLVLMGASLAALGVLASLGIVFLALGGIVLVVVILLAALIWCAGLVRTLWRWIYGQFLADQHAYWLQEGRLQVLEHAIDFEERQGRRFKYLCDAHRDWSDLISTICYFPFGDPRMSRHRRVHAADLGLPLSHQVKEGLTTQPRLEGIVAAVAANIIVPGWLASTYQSAFQYGQEEHALRTRGGPFDPDGDVSTDRDELGPRRSLVEATVSGRARQRNEFDVLNRVYQSIRSGSGFVTDPTQPDQPVVDRLFTPWAPPQTPSGFLAEVDLEPTNFNREYVPFAMVPTRRADSRQAEPLRVPDAPSIEQIQEGAPLTLPPLVFTRWVIEAVDEVEMEAVRLFSDSVEPAHLDLDIAKTRWVLPPDECEGTLKLLPPEYRDAWTLDEADLPAIGTVIRPVIGSRPESTYGPYRFMIERDGEPMNHPHREPIKYQLRRDCFAPGGVEMVTTALQCLADRTYHEFAFDGVFEGLPTHQPDCIKIGWAFNDEFRNWEISTGKSPNSRTIGWGGPGSVTDSAGRNTLSGGFVLLNADMSYEVGFLPGTSHGLVLLHELGHAMNLDHVADRREVMCSGSVPQQVSLDYGPGDAMGLRLLRIG
jgi:hypothetical protein